MTSRGASHEAAKGNHFGFGKPGCSVPLLFAFKWNAMSLTRGHRHELTRPPSRRYRCSIPFRRSSPPDSIHCRGYGSAAARSAIGPGTGATRPVRTCYFSGKPERRLNVLPERSCGQSCVADEVTPAGRYTVSRDRDREFATVWDINDIHSKGRAPRSTKFTRERRPNIGTRYWRRHTMKTDTAPLAVSTLHL